MASKYDSIWENLKLHNTCKVAIPTGVQKRVIKGVIHSKDHDAIRKLEMNSIRKKEKITYVTDGPMVTFTLTQYDNLREITLGDL